MLSKVHQSTALHPAERQGQKMIFNQFSLLSGSLQLIMEAEAEAESIRVSPGAGG